MPVKKYYEIQEIIKLHEPSVEKNQGLLKTSVITPNNPKEETRSIIDLLNEIPNPGKKRNKMEDLFDTSLSQLNSDEFIMDLEAFQKIAINFPNNRNFEIQIA